jgi:hypothetical protein
MARGEGGGRGSAEVVGDGGAQRRWGPDGRCSTGNAGKGEHRGMPAKRSRCRSRESGCDASGAEFSSRFVEGGGRVKMRGPRYTRPAVEAGSERCSPGGTSAFSFLKKKQESELLILKR